MKSGIFADVHANLEALDAVIEFFKIKDVTRFICAGDLVGYGPNPNECIDIIRNLPAIRIVAGNHDRAACGLKELTWFNEYARKAMLWTRRIISRENQIFLSELPKTILLKDMTLVHGSIRDPIDEYLLTREQCMENISLARTPVTVVGHSHIPLVFDGHTIIFPRGPLSMSLEAKTKYILNPGSVGQPRDNDNRAACGIYDTRTGGFDIHRLAYDIETTQQKMHAARLPGFLIERLIVGK
jgi:predicted phosphodiesterase